MSLKILDNFKLRSKIPLDTRSSVDNLNLIDMPYEGLISYDKTNKNVNLFQDGVFKDLFTPINDSIDSINDNVDLLNTKIQNLIINVKDFGAKGDGITDDKPFIQNAINSIAVTGGTLYFPKGNYKINSSIIIPSKSTKPLTFIGEGRATMLVCNFNGDMITFEKLTTGGLALAYHRFYNMGFSGNSFIGNGNLIHIQSTSGIVIERCYFLNFHTTGNAIYVNGNTDTNEFSHDIIICDNYFDTSSGNAGIYLSSLSSDLQINNNVMELRFGCNYCIYINNCGSLQCFDNHIYNAKVNIININGATSQIYNFFNNFLDNAQGDLIVIDGTTNGVGGNGGITFSGCIMSAIPSGFSAVKMISNIYDVIFRDNKFQWPSVGADSAIKVVNSGTVDRIYVENNSFFYNSTYVNGVINNMWGFKCRVKGNMGYAKDIDGLSGFSLNAWNTIYNQTNGNIMLWLYSNNGAVGTYSIHWKKNVEDTIDNILVSGIQIPATATIDAPILLTIPVNAYGAIKIDLASNILVKAKFFIPSN
jgi:hypothetical protein